jgi:hypothetical protein
VLKGLVRLVSGLIIMGLNTLVALVLIFLVITRLGENQFPGVFGNRGDQCRLRLGSTVVSQEKSDRDEVMEGQLMAESSFGGTVLRRMSCFECHVIIYIRYFNGSKS